MTPISIPNTLGVSGSPNFDDLRSQGLMSGQVIESNESEDVPADIDTDDHDRCRLFVSQGKSNKIAEKKRLDNAAFHDWVINTQCEAMGSSWGGKMPGKAG